MSGDPPFRVLPALSDENRFFWTSGADGRLRFLRCGGCGYYLHPPSPRCPRCGGAELAPDPVSGRGTVHSFTVNHQPWDGNPDALRGRRSSSCPSRRGCASPPTSSACPPEEVHIGMPRAGGVRAPRSGVVPAVRAGPAMTDFERRSIISGIGQSAVGRRLGRTGLDLTIEAALAAIADAGLTVADIDGLATYPGAGVGGGGLLRAGHARGAGRAAPASSTGTPAGSRGPPSSPRWSTRSWRWRRAGAARARVPHRHRVDRAGRRRAPGHRPRRRRRWWRDQGIGGQFQWSIPFRAYSAANWLAMIAQRHFHEFGTTPRAAGHDRPQRPAQRGPQPQGDLPRPDDARRLPRRRA